MWDAQIKWQFLHFVVLIKNYLHWKNVHLKTNYKYKILDVFFLLCMNKSVIRARIFLVLI